MYNDLRPNKLLKKVKTTIKDMPTNRVIARDSLIIRIMLYTINATSKMSMKSIKDNVLNIFHIAFSKIVCKLSIIAPTMHF